MLLHLLFGTPFLIVLFLWAACFTLYVVLVETGFKDRHAVAFRWAKADGWHWPWWFATLGIFASVVLGQWILDGVISNRTVPPWGPSMSFFAILLILVPPQLVCGLHNRRAKPLPPAGWFSVADDRSRQRYWNGTVWTEIYRDVATGQIQSPTPGVYRQVRNEVPPHV